MDVYEVGLSGRYLANRGSPSCSSEILCNQGTQLYFPQIRHRCRKNWILIGQLSYLGTENGRTNFANV